jgi:hypothetical protein
LLPHPLPYTVLTIAALPLVKAAGEKSLHLIHIRTEKRKLLRVLAITESITGSK